MSPQTKLPLLQTTEERDKLDRRTLLVLGAASMLPACSAGGSDPDLWSSGGNPPGTGGGTSTSTSSGGGASPSGGVTSTSSTSGGVASTSSTSTSSTSSSSTSSGVTSTSSSSSSGGMTCTTGASAQRLDFSTHPQLMNTGGSVKFQGNNYSDPGCGQPDIIVLSKGGGEYVAFSASCSHQCCTVSYSGTRLRCPCHGAQFDTTTGKCTNGIAGVPLQVLQVCVDSTGITVSW